MQQSRVLWLVSKKEIRDTGAPGREEERGKRATRGWALTLTLKWTPS
jgi:hypothetical protein